MEKIRLGRTNLKVTRLGWGGIPIQRVGEEEAVAVVRAVVDMGVDLLDTARAYTNSEGRIGLALQAINRPVVLSTKSMIRSAKIYRDVQESLQKLRVKHIHLYHMHGVNGMDEYEKAMAPGGAYEGLLRARDEGLIGHIGITSHSLSVLERAIGEGHFAVAMACYGFLEPEAADRVFPLAREKDVGMLAMKPFSGGVVEDAGPALRFVLSTPGIVPIPGSETFEKARENWRIFSEGQPLSDDDRTRIAALRAAFDRQFCRRCDYCQPCSEKINIQFALGLKTIVKRFGSQATEAGWLKALVERARSCTECRDCMPRCPYGLPIPELIKENLDWYDGLAR